MNYKKKFLEAKNFYFLNYLVFFSFYSILIGSAVLNFFVILTSLVFIIYFLKNYKIFFLDYRIICFVFILLIINIIYSTNVNVSFLRALGIIKLLFFSLSVLFLIKNKKNFYTDLLLVIFSILVLIIISMTYQYFNGSIFGYGYISNHGFSLSGIFRDEYIAGGILSKLFFITFPLFYSYKNKNLYLFIFSLIFLFFILLSNQRSPIIMFIISVFVYFLIDNQINIKKKIIYFFSLFLILFSIINFSTQLKDKIIYKTLEQFSVNEKINILDKFKNTQWGAHYLTAIEIFKDNKFTGSGLRTFRIVCSKKKYENIDSLNKNHRCATHPHNFYLEILSEMGIFVFIIFVFFLTYLFFSGLKQLIKNKYFDRSSIVLFFILFFPIQTTGSFSSSVNGFFYFIGLVFYYNAISKNNYEK